MNLSQVFQSAQAGDTGARAAIVQAAYDDLRRLAAKRMQDERQNHTLSATALVHEVSLKLLNDSQLPLANPAQFMAYVSKAMRNLLIDHARSRGRQKRGGDRQRLSFADALQASEEQSAELVELHDALEKLAKLETRKAQVIEMRYFGGLTAEETAAALDISLATVKRDWEVAKAWLKRELQST